MGSSQIRQSDVVAVKFQFVNHSGKSDSRTILIEKGMQIDLDGAKYTITDKGAVANNKGKKSWVQLWQLKNMLLCCKDYLK